MLVLTDLVKVIHLSLTIECSRVNGISEMDSSVSVFGTHSQYILLLFCTRFYSPVNNIKVMLNWTVNLLTHPRRLRPLGTGIKMDEKQLK